MEGWVEDVLGAGFEQFTIDLGRDDEGELVATLVRALPQPRTAWQRVMGRTRQLEDVDVLYVHGWNDYFYQKGLARYFTDRGARFYALDLRKFGRSLRDGQTHGYIEDLASYDVEIGLSLQLMGQSLGPHHIDEESSRLQAVVGDAGREQRRLLLMGHSEGALILALWADRHRGIADGLLFNSPWFVLQLGGAVRRALASVVNLRARFAPRDLALPQIDLGFYHEAQRRVSDPVEQASINRAWRSDTSPPVRGGWLRAILEGHARVDAGLDIDAPICALLSDRSIFGLGWRDEMVDVDTVIEVTRTAHATLKLGNEVTIERVPGALHNVFMSRPEVAARAYDTLGRWLTGWEAQTRRASGAGGGATPSVRGADRPASELPHRAAHASAD